MPEAPKPYWAADPAPSGKTFFGGYTLKQFASLPHREKLRVMAEDDKRRDVTPVQCQDPQFHNIQWTVLKAKKP